MLGAGDKVKITNDKSDRFGQVGTLKRIALSGGWMVKFDDGKTERVPFGIELVESPTQERLKAASQNMGGTSSELGAVAKDAKTSFQDVKTSIQDVRVAFSELKTHGAQHQMQKSYKSMGAYQRDAKYWQSVGWLVKSVETFQPQRSMAGRLFVPFGVFTNPKPSIMVIYEK
jgi:hypothetical protein